MKHQAQQESRAEATRSRCSRPACVVGRRFVPSLAWSCLFLIGLSASASAGDDYHLAVGDTVEVAVAGLPDLRQRVVIQPDGMIVVAPAGRVAVVGLTSAELQAKMEALLPTKLFRQRTPDGREHLVLVKPSDVTASIVEYRPVYVTGDVLTPGQHPYRPQATVRQVVALSGGYSAARARMLNPAVDPADLQRDYGSLSTEYAKEYYHALRVQAALDNKDEFDRRLLTNTPVPSAVLTEIVRSESEALKLDRADNQQEREFLEQAVRQADEQIGVLTEQEKQEERGVQADKEELDRVVKLFGNGSLPSPRVTDSRRALLLSSTRQLQATSALLQTRRQRAEFIRQLDRINNQRRLTLLRELSDANTKLADIVVKLRSLGEKGQIRGPFESSPEITIVRLTDEKWQHIPASEDTEVEAGDIVEVTLHLDPANGFAVR